MSQCSFSSWGAVCLENSGWGPTAVHLKEPVSQWRVAGGGSLTLVTESFAVAFLTTQGKATVGPLISAGWLSPGAGGWRRVLPALWGCASTCTQHSQRRMLANWLWMPPACELGVTMDIFPATPAAVPERLLMVVIKIFPPFQEL